MSDPFNNSDDPFLANGLGGAPVFSFADIGDSITGTVVKIDQANDTLPDGTVKTWPDGKPMAVFIFTLATDDGERRVFVRGNMVTAIKEAAGGRSTIGRTLTIQHHALGEKKPGKFPAKLFRAKVGDAVAPVAKPVVAAEEAW